MATLRVGDALSAGMGLALGFTMAQYMFKVAKPSDRTVKQIIVCLKCGNKNPIENKFCGQCGQAFFVGLSIKCPRCDSVMPTNMSFCGNCGRILGKRRKGKVQRKSDQHR